MLMIEREDFTNYHVFEEVLGIDSKATIFT